MKEFFYNKDLREFYNLNLLVHDIELFDRFTGNLILDELLAILPSLVSMIDPEEYDYYKLPIQLALEDAIEDYCNYIYADDYNPDVASAVSDAYFQENDGEIHIDEYQAADNIEEEVKAAVIDELGKIIQSLPCGITLSNGFLNRVSIDVIGADDLVDSYITENEESDIATYNTVFEDEIENIFEREYLKNSKLFSAVLST